MTDLKGKKAAVIGLGIEGKDLVKFLLERGDIVTVLDKKGEREIDFSGIDRKKIRLRTGKTYLEDLSKFDIIFRSPGVYRYKSEIVEAEKKGVMVSSAIKLFFDLCPGKIIGITGTKGKGTTATLIYEILKEDGEDVFLAGNIGKPYLQLLPNLNKKSWIVLELSSFQLIDLNKSPHIAVILNITSDHMDWHVSQKEYIEAKENIVRFQNKSDFGVINADYTSSKIFSELSESEFYYFSKMKKVKGCYVRGEDIVLNINREDVVGKVNDLILRGKHNWENVTAAICASRLVGADIKPIKKAVFNFRGLKHRLEFVETVDGVGYYNDSFATGPQPTIAAIKSFKEPLTLILGGFDKGLGYGEMVKEIVIKKNIKNIILIGDLNRKFQYLLKTQRYKNRIIDAGYSKMDKVVRIAKKITPKGGVVLLSPAAASFDMFKNYKDRGGQFIKAAKSS
jgi:UDP-N-acetylmuramoylalanine--D-glutamate ligase